MSSNLRINLTRLLRRIDDLAVIGAIDGGGVCRLALTEADQAGRDHVVRDMRALGLDVSIDAIGNVIGVRAGETNAAPILIGSHIDTVKTGGRYDGNLGVLAGLEVIETLNEHQMRTHRPLGVGFFTNEEGARFAPDMMGSMVHQGQLPLDEMLNKTDSNGTRVADALTTIGYAGSAPTGTTRAHAFVELHVEQGPVLEQAGITIGAVEGVQGISWTEITIDGVSNHAGTTPMHLRHDAAYVASEIAVFVRELAKRMGGAQVGTVGSLELEPNLVNVIAKRAKLTVDLRNTDDRLLREAEAALKEQLQVLAHREAVSIDHISLARFAPVAFSESMIEAVVSTARRLGHSVQRMPSGAGHDAQSFAPNCPTGMIFVPSVGGLSHNVAEFTEAEDIEAGANVLLGVSLDLAMQPSTS